MADQIMDGAGQTADPDHEDKEAITRLVAHYHKLRKEVHLPFLDTALLNKYVVQAAERFANSEQDESAAGEGSAATGATSASGAHDEDTSLTMSAITAQQQRLERQALLRSERHEAVRKLIILVGIVSDHKQRTLDVLDAVAKRETALKQLHGVLTSRASGELSAIESSIASQHNLHLLQKATLHVVERIIQWRQCLPFPHPFMAGTDNYLLKVMQDTAQLASNPHMTEAVPMQSLFLRFPLYSNLPSLGKYSDDPTKAASVRRVGVGAPPIDISFHKRLVAAEDYLHEEVERELKMLRGLLDSCRQGYFIPVLDLRKLNPGAARSGSGKAGGLPHPQAVKIFSRDVQQRLEQSLLHSLDMLLHPPFEAAYKSEVEKLRNESE